MLDAGLALLAVGRCSGGVALSSFCATLFNGDIKYMAPNSMTLFPGSEYFKGDYSVECRHESKYRGVFYFLKYYYVGGFD